jgi:YVTN family beta-propeller protein
MRYFGDFSVPEGTPLNPKDWDCTHPNSPHYKGSGAPAYPSDGYSGPYNRQARSVAATTGIAAYLKEQLRDLPFLPFFTPPSTSPPCDSSYPDVFQTIHTNSQVTRISTCPVQVVASIPVVSRPLQIAVTPDGLTALVTSFDNAVNFIDLRTNTVTFTLMTDELVNPNGVAISPDGTRAYITSFDSDDPVVQVIDMASRKIIATVMTTLQYPSGATLTPDGSQLWITGPLDYSMNVFDTLSNTLITSLNIGLTTDVAFNATGTRAYITSALNTPGTVVVVDTATFQTLTSYKVGNGPADIAMAPGGQFLVVNNDVEGSVSVIDLTAGTVSTTQAGANPSGISFIQ